MLWFSQIAQKAKLATLIGVAMFVLSSCTVQPLNATKPGAALTPSRLSGVEVFEVSNRVGQQVRNNLIFSLNGGGSPSGATHSLSLAVTANKAAISVQTSTRAPTAAQITVSANYTLRDKATGDIIASGQRHAIASYDRTNQSFANQRAERDAEDRAANEVAEQLRLVIAATLANQ